MNLEEYTGQIERYSRRIERLENRVKELEVENDTLRKYVIPMYRNTQEMLDGLSVRKELKVMTR